MQHFYDSFALVSHICVRRDALTLFGLNDDELYPDLHITGAGVLRTGLGSPGTFGQSRRTGGRPEKSPCRGYPGGLP